MNTIRRISDQQEREIEVIADLDTTFLRVNCNDLESKTRLSNIFKAIVGKDITQKMYSMSEAFERGSKKMARREARHVNLSTLYVQKYRRSWYIHAPKTQIHASMPFVYGVLEDKLMVL